MASKKRTVSEIMKTEKAEEVEKKSKEITGWIEALLGEKLPKPNLRESLLDGVVLCKLINCLVPGALKRYHKKPRMLAMKIENIGFFLATCKTRMSLPEPLLFQPTDIHDDSNNLQSMLKVLNVLSFLKGDGEGEMIQELPPDIEDEEPTATEEKEKEKAKEIEPEPEILEPEIEPEPEPTPVTTQPIKRPDPVPISVPTPIPTVAPIPTPVAAPVPLQSFSSSPSNADSGDIQSEILKAITDVINAELSIESKKKLVRILEGQIMSFNDKVMNSTEDQLINFGRDLGVDNLPRGKGREAIVDVLLKSGRVQ